MLDGKKTYISAFLLVLVGVAKSQGWLDPETADLLITGLLGGGLASLRHAQSKNVA